MNGKKHRHFTCRHQKLHPSGELMNRVIIGAMPSSIRLLLSAILLFARTKTSPTVEIIVLHQQLIILHRKRTKKPQIKAIDRLIFVLLYRLGASVRDAMHIVQPDTLVRWHRKGFRAYWR
jgi:hypothetical protein